MCARSLRDGRDLPDAQYATCEYDGWTLLFQGSLRSPHMERIERAAGAHDAPTLTPAVSPP